MSQRVPTPSLAPPAAVPVGTDVQVDPSARAIGMLGFGAVGMRAVRRWIEQIPDGVPVTWAAAQRADQVSLGELERMVHAAHVGWRLMLAGPTADVAAARAAAVRLGLLDQEIRLVVSDAELRRVWCPHCAATTETSALPGDQVDCSGCTIPLRLQQHVSRRLDAHVGVATPAPHFKPNVA